MMQHYYTTPLLWACAGIFDICTAICWGFRNTEAVSGLSCWAPCCPALFFPCGDVPDLDQSCLPTSAVHKGSRGKLFILTSFRENKPYTVGASFPPAGVRNNAEAAQTAHSCLPVGTTTGRGPVTGMVGPEQVRCRVQVLCAISELRVQPYGDIKITPHGGRYSCPSSFSGKKRHGIVPMVI